MANFEDKDEAFSFEAEFRDLMEVMDPSFCDNNLHLKRKRDSTDTYSTKRRISLPIDVNTAERVILRDDAPSHLTGDIRDDLSNVNLHKELQEMRSLLGVMADRCMREVDTHMEIIKNRKIITNQNDEISKNRQEMAHLRKEVSDMSSDIRDMRNILLGNVSEHAHVSSAIISNGSNGSNGTTPTSHPRRKFLYTRGARLQCRHCVRTFTYAKRMREHYAEEHPSASYDQDFMCGDCA